jgi:hypothetical protein
LTFGQVGPFRLGTGHDPLLSAPGVNASVMTILDLIKATLTCGAFAYLIYSFPLLGQIVLIGFLSLLWLSYARKTIASLLHR